MQLPSDQFINLEDLFRYTGIPQRLLRRRHWPSLFMLTMSLWYSNICLALVCGPVLARAELGILCHSDIVVFAITFCSVVIAMGFGLGYRCSLMPGGLLFRLQLHSSPSLNLGLRSASLELSPALWLGWQLWPYFLARSLCCFGHSTLLGLYLDLHPLSLTPC
jgi:hypothetical protein